MTPGRLDEFVGVDRLVTQGRHVVYRDPSGGERTRKLAGVRIPERWGIGRPKRCLWPTCAAGSKGNVTADTGVMITSARNRPPRQVPQGRVRPGRAQGIMTGAVAVAAALLLSGCGGSDHPPAIKAANWSTYEISDRDTVVGLLEQWAAKAKIAEGVLEVVDGMNMADARTRIRITHANGWRSIQLTGERGSWEERPLGSKKNPVVVWVRDMVPGETTADIVICDQRDCTDVTAWYVLANFNEELGFPDEIAGLLPQDAAEVSRVGNSDTFVIEHYLDHVDDPVVGSVIDDGVVTNYSLKDRVYIRGQREGGTGMEDCVGWLDRVEDLQTDADRFAYFCFSPNAGVFSGLHRLSGLKSFEALSEAASSTHSPEVGADLYGDLTDNEKAILQLLGAVEPAWAERHERQR